MILQFDEIEKIIKENPGAKRIQQGRDYLKNMRRHIYGESLENYLKSNKNLEIYETESKREARAKYTKSNKDLFSRLSRPIDKVFTAKGGSVYYNLGETQQKKAVQLSQNVAGNLSVRKWVETFWKPHMLDDPFGVVFLEILPDKEAILAKREGRSFVYPTYKPISSIYDYRTTGNKLEWVVFTLTPEERQEAGIKDDVQAYRLVDDANDYYVVREGEEIKILDFFTLDNFFGQVPGIVNSDLPDPSNEELYVSFFHDVLELAEQFLLKGSIKVTHDFLHGFPKYSEFASSCSTCKGTGVYQGVACSTCNGSGKSWITDISKVKLLSMPSSKEDAIVLPQQIGAYISPDKTFYEISTDDLHLLEDLMTFTLWGTQVKSKTSGMSIQQETRKTATEVVDEIKPEADRLFVISEMAEKRHKFILDMIIRVQVSPTYKGSSVNYGRRYLLESPDVLWQKYSQARQQGSPLVVLDTLLNEYYDANFQSDPIELEISKKLMYVEPLVHYTAMDLTTMMIDDADYKAKLFFSEWLSQTEDAELVLNDIPTLRKSLYDYTATKKLKEPEKPELKAA
jgi:hypothetical protein